MALAAAVPPGVLVSRDSKSHNNDNTIEITQLLTSLDTTVKGLLSDIGGCKDKKCTDGVTGEISAALDTTTSELVGLVGIVTDEVEDLLSGILAGITSTFDTHKSSCHGKCGDLHSSYSNVDESLTGLLTQLESSVNGILKTVLALAEGLVKDLLTTLTNLPLLNVSNLLGGLL